MAQVNIRMDAEMKKQAEDFFAALGLTMSTAITAFIAQSLREGRIPFELSLKPSQEREQRLGMNWTQAPGMRWIRR